jgi:cytochrome b6-f complex iron-sulfur subunit
MERRSFLKASCALCGLGIAGTAAFLESCKKTDTGTPQGPTVNFTLDLSQSANNALNYGGGSVASNGVIVINSGSFFYAVAQACTHQQCNVAYNFSTNNLVCPCHNGTYDLSGKVVSGPPPAPLKSYKVTKSGSILTISG